MEATFQTAQAYADAHGLNVVEVRKLARTGRIPGAVRIGSRRSAWAIPVAAPVVSDTAARELMSSRAAADTRPVGADVPNLMSTGETPAQIARRVESRVRVVTTRPAQALADVVFMAADVAAMHTSDRDARCTRCGWTWPCPDRAALDQLLRRADLITDGRA